MLKRNFLFITLVGAFLFTACSQEGGAPVGHSDVTAPVLSVPAAITMEASASQTSVTLGTASASDLVDGVVSVSNDAPATFPVGITTITYTATDAAGNTVSATQTVTITDTTAPVITLPADVNVEANAVLSTVTLGTATASDVVDGVVSVSNDAPATFPLGTTVITYTATDVAGNTATATQNVTVVDTTVPVLSVPAAITMEASASLTSVTLGAATATDIFGATVTNDAPATFPVGITTITYTATDGNGLTSTATQTVTITDTTAPVITLPADVNVEANAVLSTVTLGTATASDVVDGVVSVSNDAPATFPLGTTVITYTATDVAGNTATATQNVTVVDTTVPVLSVPAAITMEASASLTSVTLGAATATDIFGATVTNDAPATFPVGITTITYTATDGNGLTSTATQTVTITDTTAPVITLPAEVTVITTTSQTPVTFGSATATDIFGVTITSDAPAVFPVGTTTVTWTATDANGNVVTGTQLVTVRLDTDGDGVIDANDAFPTDPAASVDTDGDGFPDAWNPGKTAADSTTGITMLDAFPTDPTRWNPDTDGDGVLDNVDAFVNDPAASVDTDGDGYPDAWNANATAAQIAASSLQLDAFPADPAAAIDADGDGFAEAWLPTATAAQIAASSLALDVFPNNPLEWADMDGDGIGDNSDPDIDGDGTSNVLEAQLGYDPRNAASVPPDGDGDGYPDAIDLFPADPLEWADLDRDGIGDNSDPDIDGDGVANALDAYPLDGTRWVLIVDSSAPVLQISSPAAGGLTANAQVVVSGVIQDDYSVPSLTINGTNVAITYGASGLSGGFTHVIDMSAQADGLISLLLVATDSSGNTAQITHSFTLDTTLPNITISTANIQPSPTVNTVNETPYLIEGSITDAALAGFSINGQQIGLLPGLNANTFTFSTALQLPIGSIETAKLEAWDDAGNRVALDYLFNANIPVTLEIISPAVGAELLAASADTYVEVVARVWGISSGDVVKASIDNGAFTQLLVDVYSASGSIGTPAIDGEHTLAIEVYDSAGAVLARTTSAFNIVNSANIGLSLVKTEPAENVTDARVNDPIHLYFNKPINPALLNISVKESAHGFTYDAYSQLVEVHRDQEVVTGGLSMDPGNQLASFYPSRELSFHANVYVDVSYDGQLLKRYTYQIRELPTMAQGVVFDQDISPISNIDIVLPDLGLVRKTSSNGAYGFGFTPLPNEKTLTGGRYRMVINPDMKNASYGTMEVWANIEDQRLTELPNIRLPRLDKHIPNRFIRSGDAVAIVGDASVTLDLTYASILFPNHREEGNVHVQYLDLGKLPHRASPVAMPMGMYSTQPTGITVHGDVGVTIALQPLFGGYDYIPADGSPVVMLGFDNDAKRIVPIGVGRVNQRTLRSEGKLWLKNLDYIGFALASPKKYADLESYIKGEIALHELIAVLGAQ